MPENAKQTKRGRKPKEHRKVKVIETGKIYDSYREAAHDTNSNRGDVYLTLTGMRKKHNGYTFVFVDA